jgi:DNA-binding MarR family transcriptional regulator
VVQISTVAIAALRALQDAILREPHRALTVEELTERLRLDRRVLDGALGELDDGGLVRVRGDVTTHRSYVELTDAGERALEGAD